MENNSLAIVFSKNQCSSKPSYHRTYRDKQGKPLKMRIVMLPSIIFRPADCDFGIDSSGINRNERIAYLNVPWDMIKHDKKDDQKRYVYLNRDEYNIQFKGYNDGNGNIEKIDPVTVTASELEKIFNWSRRRENQRIINERLEKENSKYNRKSTSKTRSIK